MPTILFVCTGNRFRSPLAAACFARELEARGLQQAWRVQSAGTWTSDGLPAADLAIDLARRLGLDIGNHRSRVITPQLVEDADLIVVMEQGQEEALRLEFPQSGKKLQMLSELGTGSRYDVPDPAGSLEATGVEVEIRDLVHKGFDHMRELAGDRKLGRGLKRRAVDSARGAGGTAKQPGTQDLEEK